MASTCLDLFATYSFQFANAISFSLISIGTRIKDLQNIVVKENEDTAHCVPFHPLYETGLSVDELYADIVIKEDLASIQQTDIRNPDDRHRPVSKPSDIFTTTDGEPVRNVYMLGQPGYGKTTFCLHLLKLWCAAINAQTKAVLPLWQSEMLAFDFVFYIALRYVDSCRSSLVDMVCEDIFERDYGYKDVIRHVISSPDYRCLLLVDGLDEWVCSPEIKSKLRHKGLPNASGLSSKCTVLYASRHWKLELINPKYSKNDKVLEILGLTDEGINTIIQNILVNFYKTEIGSPVFKAKLSELKEKIQKSKSSLKVPMFVTMYVFLGYKNEYVQESVTGLYMDQLELLISKALDCDRIDKTVTDKVGKISESTIQIPIIHTNELISKFRAVFYKLGKIAFNDLISKESRLVFKRETLLEDIGENELDIALKVGVVGQMRAPVRSVIPKVSIEFLHKSMQEALAALYVACDTSVALTSLLEYLCSIEKVMEMSNVLQCIAGFSPAKGCRLSQQIVHLAKHDQEIMSVREILDFKPGRAGMVYELQCQCYKEIANTLSLIGDSDSTSQYHVADVLLFNRDDKQDEIRMIGDMIRGCPGAVLSFSMVAMNDRSSLPEHILKTLPKCSNMVKLQLMYDSTGPDEAMLDVLTTLKNLQHVGYCFSDGTGARSEVDSRVVCSILQLPRLKSVQLECVKLNDKTLILTSDMGLLQKVELKRVRMSHAAWQAFGYSLRSVKQGLDITVVHDSAGVHRNDANSTVIAIMQLPHLKHVTFRNVEMNDETLRVTEDIGLLQTIELDKVSMSPIAWKRFVTNLSTSKHAVDVKVKNCEVDGDTVGMICKPEYFTVTYGRKDWHKKKKIRVDFTSLPKDM